MSQLQLWNPDLKDDCSNLQLNDAYCVSGDVGGTGVLTSTTPATTPVRVRAVATGALDVIAGVQV